MSFIKYLKENLNEENENPLDRNKFLIRGKSLTNYKGEQIEGMLDHFPDEDIETNEKGYVTPDAKIWDRPDIRWFDQEQNGPTREIKGKNSAEWGHGIYAMFPDGYWAEYDSDWDSSD